MSGQDVRGQDPSDRLKRPAKTVPRTKRTNTAANVISPLPKAAIASTSKTMRDDFHRRKNSSDDKNVNSGSVVESIQHSLKLPNQPLTLNNEREMRPASRGDISYGNRITDLENALATAQAEHARMSDEIHILRSEQALLQENVANSRLQYPPREILLSEPIAPNNVRRGSSGRYHLEDQIRDLKQQISNHQDELNRQEAVWKSQWESERSSRIAEHSHLVEKLHLAEKEASERRVQLLELKQSISSMTRIQNQIPDNELIDRLNRLHYRIREWAVSSFRRVKLNFLALSEDTKEDLRFVKSSGLVTTNRIPILQSIVIANISDILLDKHYYGIPPDSTFRHLSEQLEDNTDEYSQWHGATLALLSRKEESIINTHTDYLLGRILDRIVNIVAMITQVDPSQSVRDGLISILSETVAVSRILRLQFARYSAFLPFPDENHTSRLDENRIEYLEFGDEDAMPNVCSMETLLFPGIIKMSGGTQQIILRAKATYSRPPPWE